MAKRQFFDEYSIYEQDIVSNNSEVAGTIYNATISKGSDSGKTIVCSYKYNPSEILDIAREKWEKLTFSDNKIYLKNKESLEYIGEYGLLASPEHSFNAVILLFEGSNYLNIRSSNGANIYLTVADISMSLVVHENVVSTHFFAFSNMNNSILFKDCPIAQEVYDSHFVNEDSVFSSVSEDVPEWFKKASEKKAAASSKGGCYVATAVYGSYDCPQVWTLRRYRDYNLALHWYGRVFIHTYYAISPTLVKWFGNTVWFNRLWRGKLDKMVENLQLRGYEATPYEDK